MPRDGSAGPLVDAPAAGGVKRAGGLPTWALAAAPLAILGALIAWVVAVGPARLVTGDGYPPVERLSIARATLTPDGISLSVLNDGREPVTIAQVMVDDAFWNYQAEPGPRLGPLGRARIEIPYPWVAGETHVVRLLTSTGATFDHTIDVAVETPAPSLRTAGVFALIGVYVGVLPVAIGLLWYPLVGRLGARALDFVLALTVGLLAFLFVDGAHDGLESAAAVPEAFQGVVLFVFGAVAAWIALDAVGARLAAQRAAARADGRMTSAGWTLALLIAIGIGLHNFGEGLAIGSAFALGQLALGSLLIVGFALHNTTEGLAIVAPLAREDGGRRAPLSALMRLGLIGGVPTIAGAWLGGFVASPVWSVLMLGLGVGAIGQVMRQILRQTAGERGLGRYLLEGPVLAGLAAGVLVMYVTGMFAG